VKLEALKASSVRGIPRDWPKLAIGEKGLIIYGPNGVGKSSVIDAIEFVLTQQSTLFSENRQGVSWETASPHVRDGTSEITITINDNGTQRDVKSGSPHPTDLSAAACSWLEAAKKSRFVLRRHMLLRFIVRQPAGRYGQLEPFFNMGRSTRSRLPCKRWSQRTTQLEPPRMRRFAALTRSYVPAFQYPLRPLSQMQCFTRY
jgi:hypothetical protein